LGVALVHQHTIVAFGAHNTTNKEQHNLVEFIIKQIFDSARKTRVQPPAQSQRVLRRKFAHDI